jgi:hypothetical protein
MLNDYQECQALYWQYLLGPIGKEKSLESVTIKAFQLSAVVMELLIDFSHYCSFCSMVA